MVTAGDFIGKFEVAVNDITQPNLLIYIDRYEEYFATVLFGKELYDLWAVDPDAVPYNALTEPFIFQSSCGVVHQSKGIRDMLTGFIYFNYTRDIRTQQSLGGAVAKANENSMTSTSAQSFNWQRWNESITTFYAIQSYIRENIDLYPTFKGQELDLIIPYF